MKNKTKVFRKQNKSNYTIVNNEILRRKDLSWKAKGIMIYILSLPDDWTIYLEEVMQHSTDGRDSFRTGWKELEEAGYVKRYPYKEKGIIKEWRTVVSENADLTDFSPDTDFPDVVESEETQPDTDFPEVEKPQVDNPQMEKPQVENPKLLSTYSTKDLKELSTESTNTTTTTSSENENAFRFYESNGYGMIAPLVRDRINGWIDDISKTGTSEEEADGIVRKAMEFGVLNNKRSWGYVNRILIDWENRGLNTLDKLAAAENQREAEKEKNQKTNFSYGGRKPVRKETLPDWATEDREIEEKPLSPEDQADFKKRLERIRSYRKEES